MRDLAKTHAKNHKGKLTYLWLGQSWFTRELNQLI